MIILPPFYYGASSYVVQSPGEMDRFTSGSSAVPFAGHIHRTSHWLSQYSFLSIIRLKFTVMPTDLAFGWRHGRLSSFGKARRRLVGQR
jgi:hypothetical protein